MNARTTLPMRGWAALFVLLSMVASALVPGAAWAAPSQSREVITVAGDTADTARQLTGATGQVTEPNFVLHPSEPRVTLAAEQLWWEWTAPSAGPYTFATHGSEFDTLLTVTSLFPRDQARPQVSDDTGDVRTSEVTVRVEKGERLRIGVTTKDREPGLASLSWHPAQQAAVVDVPQTFSALSAGFAEIPVSTNSGEKPQAKAWQHGGSWWVVMASTQVQPMGTWLWELDGSRWHQRLLLSSATSVRADSLPAGNVVHVLLHGPDSSLVSLQYDASAKVYQPWSQRPNATRISLPGSETATIALDTTGRIWLAADEPPRVQVRYSDPPYSRFSAPVTLASNINQDDITAVTALPNGRVAVMWSNQTTKRFGFRTHVDGSSPSTWTKDEVPAGSSALNVGNGMADDHVNLSVAADGTVYAAVKTSYNSSNHPVIALLVRRPNGTWDPLHEVARQGTRPIVLLNEATRTVHVFYTEREGLHDIHHRSSPMGQVSFTGDPVEVLDGDLNNVSSTKANWVDDWLVLATTAATARHVLLSPPAPPGAPVAVDGAVQTVLGAPVDGRLTFTGGNGGAVRFEVVDQPVLGSVQLLDATTGRFRYQPGSSAGSDEFTFRVRQGGLVSGPGRISVLVGSASGMRGHWSFEEGAGSVAGDTSEWGNHGVLAGGARWGAGASGSGLVLNGVGGRVVVPDSSSIDVSGAMTVAAWIRPSAAATQYVVKKAAQHSVDGYELGLSSSRTVFLRLNQATSGNTFRVDSTTLHPINGRDWMHVAGVSDGTTMRLFVNGVQQATAPAPRTVASNALDLTLGAEDGGYRSMAGGLDDVRLYSRALSAQEIAALAGRS